MKILFSLLLPLLASGFSYKKQQVEASSFTALGSRTTLSRLECGSFCLTTSNCSGFYWNSDTQICQTANALFFSAANAAESSKEVYVEADKTVDGRWTEWTSICSRDCYHSTYYPTSTQTRSRTCVSPAFGGVRTCPDEGYQEEVIGQNCNPTTCPTLKQIDTKTKDISGASIWYMFSGLKLKLTNIDGRDCLTASLDNLPETNLGQGYLDSFSSASVMDQCYGFPVPLKYLLETRVIHFGSDNWDGEWVKIYFSDGTNTTCIPDPPLVFPTNVSSTSFLINNDEYMLAKCT